MKKKILVLLTNTNKYEGKDISTGLWLGELTHFYDVIKAAGFEMDIASPKGGNVPIDPESLKFLMADASVKAYQNSSDFMKNLSVTKAILGLNVTDYAAIYLAGGHGTMYDFVGNESLNTLLKDFYEAGKVVSAVCHGVCGLLDVKLSDGSLLIADKNTTGYSWFEETLAARKNAVPFNLEQEMKNRKTKYTKAFIPLTSYVQVDGKLVTGQNPFSTKAVAKAVVELLT